MSGGVIKAPTRNAAKSQTHRNVLFDFADTRSLLVIR
jgi:hypothetical protein